MELLLGIDGGGTGCRAALADKAGRVIGRGKSGSANIMTDIEGARVNILAATRQALQDAGLDATAETSISAVLGLAGANVGDNAPRLEKLLPFARARVKSDAIIALYGAIGDADGTVVILGTGSVFVTRKAGHIRTIGGWGFKVSDLGSGARLGRDLLEEALLAHDGVHSSSPLAEKTMAMFDNDPHRIVTFARSAGPNDFGTYAPLVFEYAENGDRLALLLIERAVKTIEEALDAVMPPEKGRLCLIGGLGPLYASRLSPKHRARLHAPLGDALGGAVKLAVELFAHAEADHG
ncbi:N-acetylglucosamine kinase [Phyllobacterium salinisoli]|uniref:N-acetylglucosamine kinase n=1 Tax=Phyllobacterium salinisoli TaxID=1899321 RepID=A0A368K7I1_9HYPH|nr:N-acetylglucosamine kinase [Phyllobacterium salinisoli]RCS24010.1 N-acetylglucosamine kinase [Phyllobacterium salinisoli]